MFRMEVFQVTKSLGINQEASMGNTKTSVESLSLSLADRHKVIGVVLIFKHIETSVRQLDY